MKNLKLQLDLQNLIFQTNGQGKCFKNVTFWGSFVQEHKMNIYLQISTKASKSPLFYLFCKYWIEAIIQN
jgi:hypothetical protein